MRHYILHVSNPVRDGRPIVIPKPVAGEYGRYLYDRSTRVARAVLPGCSLYLWGSRKSGRHGLFAVGACTGSDLEPPFRQSHDFDALLELRHDAVSSPPIGPEEILRRYPELSGLVRRVDSSSLLDMNSVEEAETRMLHSLFGKAV